MCLIGFTGYQAVTARDALQAAAADLESFAKQTAAGANAKAAASLTSAQEEAETARTNTRGPGWWIAGKSPVIGDDVAAVRTVADSVETLASDVLPKAVDASKILSPDKLQPVDGRVNLDPIKRVAPAVIAANRAVALEHERIAAIDSTNLIGAVRGPVVELEQRLAEASALTEKGARAVRLLPPMLGSEGKRTYLVLFQNNAEIRATGGLPGSIAILTADNGRIRMGSQGGIADLGIYATPAAPLTAEEVALFEPKLGTLPQDSNFTPDFPRTAELVQAMWLRSNGQKVDGVISTDPVALSHLLGGTGPVEMGTGERLTEGNAVRMLLSDVYLQQPDPELQNEFFEAAARDVFDALASGQGNPRGVLDGLVRSVEERRLLVWSSTDSEQALLAPTRLSGALPTGESATGESDRPQIGVYLNDGTGAKMHYYFHHDVSVESTDCEDGVQGMRVTVTMRSDAPTNARELPVSVVGGGFGARPGATRTEVLLYAPIGGAVQAATLDGAEFSYASLPHEGREVASQTIDLDPGQKVTLRFSVKSGQDQTGLTDLRVTPGVRGTGVGVVGPSACAP